jgi:hypothetical protein
MFRTDVILNKPTHLALTLREWDWDMNESLGFKETSGARRGEANLFITKPAVVNK